MTEQTDVPEVAEMPLRGGGQASVADTLIWEGTPSQLVNIFYFAKCLLALAVVSIVFSAVVSRYGADPGTLWPWTKAAFFVFMCIPAGLLTWRYAQTASTIYRLSTEQLATSYGVFNKTTDHLELYRVKDYKLVQPFTARVFGLSNIDLITQDRTDAFIEICGVRNGADLLARIRDEVESLRSRKARVY